MPPKPPSSASSPSAGTPADGKRSDGQMAAVQSNAQAAAVQSDQQIGEFKLLRQLGKGGMAQVWLAEQTSLHRNVALKILRSDLMSDANYVARFQTEAKAAAGLNHPNIVQVYVIGEDAGRHFIAQEYVQGGTLRALMQRKGPLELQFALHVMRQIAAALQAAGERGIVHRDIKPENIMLTKKGEVKVADFGLAQLTLSSDNEHLTQEGMTMGTPLYMSPEQIKAASVDARSDLYSFGITCYHMLSGKPPFWGETAIRIAMQHVHDAPPPLQELRPDLPQSVCDLVHRLIAKSPDDRYPDAATVLEDIRKLIRGLKDSGQQEPIKLSDIGETGTIKRTLTGRYPRLSLTLLCLLAALGSGAIGWWTRPGDPRELPPAANLRAEVPRASSARQQFVNAMLKVNDPYAFEAVTRHWDQSPDGEPWVARAREQLVLLALNSPDQHDDATRELHALRTVTGTYAEEFEARSWAGEAALLASRGDLEGARRILRQHRQALEDFHLLPDGPPGADASAGEPWRRLLDDLVNRRDSRRPPP